MSGNKLYEQKADRTMRELSIDELNAVAGGVTEGPDGSGCTDSRGTTKKPR